MIVRHRHASGFTILPNNLLKDDRLSYEALGVLCYLLSRPRNWNVVTRQLCARSKGGGRDRMRRILNELIDAGYVYRSLRRDGTRISGIDYLVTDIPIANPSEPPPDLPAPRDQATSTSN